MRIKYGGGAGQTQSLQNYQYEKGDNATLGNRVQTRAGWWGSRQGRLHIRREHSPPHPLPDGSGPALESHMGTEGASES